MSETIAPPLSSSEKVEELIRQAISAGSIAQSLERLRAAANLVKGEPSAQAAWVEALTGYMLYVGGSFDAARGHFEASEKIWRIVAAEDSPKRRAATLGNYANLLCDLGIYSAARSRMETAREIERKLFGEDDPEYARTLLNLARIQRLTGQAEEACENAQQAAGILEQGKEPRDQADALYAKNILGMALMDCGRWVDALTTFKTLSASEHLQKGSEIEYSVLTNIGWALYGMGDYRAAASEYEKALVAINQSKGDAARIAEATLLTNLGSVRQKLEDFTGACRAYEDAREVMDSVVPDRRHDQTATIECNWGGALMRLRRLAEAKTRLGHALAIRQNINGPDHAKTADVRFHLAEVAFGENAFDGCLTQAVDVLALSGLYDSPDALWRVFDLIGRALAAKDRGNLAILFGKQAVQIVERLRLGIAVLGRHSQQQFLISRAVAYRDLADQLVSDHRLAEAEHVLERLRAAEQDELFGGRSELSYPDQPGFTRWEEDQRQPYAEALDEIAALRSALIEQVETGSNPEGIAAIRANIAKAATALSLAVAALIDAPEPEMATSVLDAVSEVSDRLLPALGPDDLFLQVFAAQSRLWIVRRDGQGNATRTRLDIDPTTMNNLVFDFRYALSDPAMPIDAVKLAGARLYDLLLRPVLADRSTQGARLHLALDGALRFMPPAALFDGERYLIEKIPVSLYSPFAKPDAGRRSLAENGVAGFALTREVEGFEPLPFAVEEVKAVVGDGTKAGLFKGEGFMDERFTAANLQQAANRFGCLLIASHFILRPADLARSGLLTGNGQLMPLSEITAMDFAGVELVTLSSCDSGTAGVDGDVALLQSFADRLLLRGAGTVLASLWRVADSGSARLVTEFYARLAQASGKDFAAALAAAQAAMLHGAACEVQTNRSVARGIGGKSEDVDLTETGFRHPYYWAPFVVLGDGGAQ